MAILLFAAGARGNPGNVADDADLHDATPEETRDAEEHDLALIAEAHGWSDAEAWANQVATDTIGNLAQEVASRWPDKFVGSEVAVVPGQPPTLYIKGSANDEILALVNQALIEVALAGDQPFSFSELQERNAAVHHALLALGFDHVSSGAPIAGMGDVEARVLRREGSPATAAEIVAALPEALRASVTVTVIDQLSGGEKNAFGGMVMLDDGQPECSSGWSVIGDGVSGITTAGHCVGINQINDLGHGIHATSFVEQHRGPFGDIEWHTTNQPEPDDFWADNGLKRDVAAVEAQANIAVNEAICTYSLFSNPPDANCTARVDQPNWGCSTPGATMLQMVLMDREVTVLGDSGGPWYYGTKAYGSLYGVCDTNPGQDMFSVADLYDNALDITVKT